MLNDPINNRNSKFMKLVIDKLKLSYKFEVYKELEEYNVEFPVYNKDYNVLSIFGEFLNIDGLLILKGGIIIKKIFIEDRKLYGEPSITNNNCIICYTYDNKLNSYLYIYDIDENKSLEIKLDTQMIKGFHSIFVGK